MLGRTLLIAALISLVFAAHVWAKGITAEIVVRGSELTQPVVIADVETVGQFSIWSGPNSHWRSRIGEWQTDYGGLFIDFPAGKAPGRPAGLIEFDVEFHLADSPESNPWDEQYRVRYGWVPLESGGFFYLPTRNPFVHHGVEGHWFRSTESWERLVRPSIENHLKQGD